MADDLQDAAMEAATTFQTAHIKSNPDKRDLAPGTAADEKEPVIFDNSVDLESELGEVEEDEIPLSVLRPLPRDPPRHTPQKMPLPDLRFEQSYLKSIESAETWQMITYITIKDQVLMPLLQGLGWTLVVAAWRHVNVNPNFAGQSAGARLRRWWWGVNNWKIPSKY